MYLRPLKFFFCIGSHNGVDKDAKFGMNSLKRLVEHINDFMSLIHHGSFKFLIASGLWTKRAVPSGRI